MSDCSAKDFVPIAGFDPTWEFDAPKFTSFADLEAEDISTNDDGFFVERKENAELRPAKLFGVAKDEPSLVGCESEDEKLEVKDVPVRKSSRMAARRSSLVTRVDDVVIVPSVPHGPVEVPAPLPALTLAVELESMAPVAAAPAADEVLAPLPAPVQSSPLPSPSPSRETLAEPEAAVVDEPAPVAPHVVEAAMPADAPSIASPARPRPTEPPTATTAATMTPGALKSTIAALAPSPEEEDEYASSPVRTAGARNAYSPIASATAAAPALEAAVPRWTTLAVSEDAFDVTSSAPSPPVTRRASMQPTAATGADRQQPMARRAASLSGPLARRTDDGDDVVLDAAPPAVATTAAPIRPLLFGGRFTRVPVANDDDDGHDDDDNNNDYGHNDDNGGAEAEPPRFTRAPPPSRDVIAPVPSRAWHREPAAAPLDVAGNHSDDVVDAPPVVPARRQSLGGAPARMQAAAPEPTAASRTPGGKRAVAETETPAAAAGVLASEPAPLASAPRSQGRLLSRVPHADDDDDNDDDGGRNDEAAPVRAVASRPLPGRPMRVPVMVDDDDDVAAPATSRPSMGGRARALSEDETPALQLQPQQQQRAPSRPSTGRFMPTRLAATTAAAVVAPRQRAGSEADTSRLSLDSMARPSTPTYHTRHDQPGYATPTFASAQKARDKVSTQQLHQQHARAPTPTRSLTVPMTPELATRARPKHVAQPSSTAMELARIADEKRLMLEKKERERLALLQARRTHAAPVKPVTEPEPFDLRTDRRLGPAIVKPDYVPTAALAQKVLTRSDKPVAIGLNTSAQQQQQQQHRQHASFTSETSASAPVLATDSRLRGTAHLKTSEERVLERIRTEKQEIAERRRRDEERLTALVAMRPAPQPRPHTEPEPFELESKARHERARREFELRVERERAEEEQARVFKARPALEPTLARPVASSQRPLTNPVAPSCVDRALHAEEAHRAKQQQQRDEEERLRVFRARQLPSTTYRVNPLPEVPAHAPVVPADVTLRTDVRGEMRAHIEAERARSEQEAQRQREQWEAEEHARRDEELRAYRRSLVHKPLPVPPSSLAVAEARTEAPQRRPMAPAPASDFSREIPVNVARPMEDFYKTSAKRPALGGRFGRVSLAPEDFGDLGGA